MNESQQEGKDETGRVKGGVSVLRGGRVDGSGSLEFLVIYCGSLGHIVEDNEDQQNRKNQGVRIVAWNIDLYNLSWRSSCILHKEVLYLHPPLLVVHHPRQILHLRLLQPQQPHHAVHQLLGTAAVVQHFLVDQLGDLPQVDGVVEFVVDFEEGGELVEREGVLRGNLLYLTQHDWRCTFPFPLGILIALIVTDEEFTFSYSCCHSFTLTKYFPSKVALQTVSYRPARIMQWQVSGRMSLPAMARPSPSFPSFPLITTRLC